MKVFYCYASKNHNQDATIHKEIIKFLKESGHLVEEYRFVFSELVEPGSRDENPAKIVDKIRSSDAFIGEMSRASQTLGFLLAFAVYHGKPSLYLYPSESLGKPGKLIVDNPSRLLSVEEYSDFNFENKISKFLKRVDKQLKSSRITFVSTKEINNFIDVESEKRGISKGEIIRDILERALTA